MNRVAIKNLLLRTKPSMVPGLSNDGEEVRVKLRFTMKEPTARALEESATCRRSGLDLRTFTGPLDRVFFSGADQFCFTILAKERVDVRAKKFCYRTFNVDMDQVESVEVLEAVRPCRIFEGHVGSAIWSRRLRA